MVVEMTDTINPPVDSIAFDASIDDAIEMSYREDCAVLARCHGELWQ